MDGPAMQPPALADLVVRAAQGDAEAESVVCRRFAPAIRTFARRRVRNSDAVDEFTQDVLLVVVESLRSGAAESPARFAGFVLGVCHNVARERARTRDRRAALWERYGAVLVAFESDDAARSGEDVARLEDCLSQLSDRSREVVRHAYVEGLSNVAIAEALRLSEGNVRVVRHRTLAALRECMESEPTKEDR